MNNQSMFADFLLRFSPERSVAPPARKDDLAGYSTTIAGAELTFYHNPRSHSLLREQRSKGWQLWCIGEVWTYGDAWAKENLLTLLCSDLDDRKFRPETLNGHYILIGADLAHQTWHIWTNRFGTLHAYYSVGNGPARVGTCFHGVSATCSVPNFDWLALAGFAAFGFFPQDRTHYETVRILRPATHYVFSDNGELVGQHRFWEWWHKPDYSRSYRDTVEEFGDVFGHVLDQQTGRGETHVPLSGGLDSRSTVAHLTSPTSSHKKPWPHLSFYSYGYTKDSVENEIARRLARVRGLPLTTFVLPPYLFDNLELVEASVEGFQDVTQSRQAAIIAPLATNADYLLAAHWGDVWLDDLHLPQLDQDQSLTPFILGKYMRKGSNWLLENLRFPFKRNQIGEILKQIVDEELGLISGVDEPSVRLKAWKTEQWSFRYTTASLRMFQPACFPRLPFYDQRMTDFFCTVPTSYLTKRKLQIDYLKTFAPDLARVKWQPFDANLYTYRYHDTLLLPKRAVRKAWRLLSGKKVVEANWQLQFLSPQGRRGLTKWLLKPGLLIHEFVPPQQLRKLVDDLFAHPSSESGYAASMLLTLSVWLEERCR